MTTTAHEDQFTIGTQTIETVRQPYGTVAILRRNVADLELALRTQTERAEAAEAELAQARQQKPVAYVKYKATGGNVGLSWLAVPTGEFYPREGEPLYVNPVPAPAVPELDPMTRLIVSDPKQIKPKKQEPAVPTVVFVAHNKTCSVIFADRNAADQFASSCGPSAGVAITECAVIGSQSAEVTK